MYARAAFKASKAKLSMLENISRIVLQQLEVHGLSMKIVCWILKTKPLVKNEGLPDYLLISKF